MNADEGFTRDTLNIYSKVEHDVNIYEIDSYFEKLLKRWLTYQRRT